VADILSDWQPGYKKPILLGVYMIKTVFGCAYSYWDGYNWCLPDWTESKEQAFNQRGTTSPTQDRVWRGLIDDGK
jgi:hypothetical protein